MPTLSGLPDIWDIYQQMQPGGWSPPAGIEGAKRGFSTSGNAAWQQAQSGNAGGYGGGNPGGIPDTGMNDLMAQQRRNAPNLGGIMPKRNQTYFPNVTYGVPATPGMAEGQARMAEIAATSTYKSRRAGGSMVYSPEKGSMWVPFSQQQGYANKGYGLGQPLPTQKELQTTIQQGKAYGESPASNAAPLANMQDKQYLGGDYTVHGGVFNPTQRGVSPFPNVFNNPAGNAFWNFGARNLAAAGNLASNVFSGISRMANKAFNPTSYTQTGVSPFYPPQSSSGYANTGPRKYFDF